MSRRVLSYLCCSVLGVSAAFWQGKVCAQDDTITNAAQFASVLEQEGLDFPLVSVTESLLFNPTLDMFWADFDQLTNVIGAVRNDVGQVQFGATALGLRLTRTATGTSVTDPWSGVELLQIPAQEDDEFTNRYAEVFRSWCTLTGKDPTSAVCSELIADGCSFLNPKRIVLDIWLADANDCPVNSNLSMSMMEDSDSCDSCDDPPSTDSDLEFNAFDPNDPPCGRLTYNKFKIQDFDEQFHFGMVQSDQRDV